eukprot:747705-Hanusia_phi.AAC.2
MSRTGVGGKQEGQLESWKHLRDAVERLSESFGVGRPKDQIQLPRHELLARLSNSLSPYCSPSSPTICLTSATPSPSSSFLLSSTFAT